MIRVIVLTVGLILVLILGCKDIKRDLRSTANNDSIRNEVPSMEFSAKTEEALGTKETDQSNDCFEKSKFILPYQGKIDIDNVVYNELSCDIKGVSEFLCDQERLRYISLPDYKNISVILVPQDCGDFDYRFYLLTISGGKVVSSQYVEGVWYEPGDGDYKEITSFTIDPDYSITIKTDIIENGVSSNKEVVVYKISNQGELDKTEK